MKGQADSSRAPSGTQPGWQPQEKKQPPQSQLVPHQAGAASLQIPRGGRAIKMVWADAKSQRPSREKQEFLFILLLFFASRAEWFVAQRSSKIKGNKLPSKKTGSLW